MSATRMLVLGFVRMAGAAHGYQVRSELLSWKAQEWARTNPGSIYHALRKAAADGLLAEVPDEAPEPGPERVKYAVTEAGTAELTRLIREGLATAGDPWMINGALALLTMLTREEALAALEERMVRQEAAAADLAAYRDAFPQGKPSYLIEQAHLWSLTLEAERQWTRDLRGRLLAGDYDMA